MKRIKISHLEPIQDMFGDDPEKVSKGINYVLDDDTQTPWWLICITGGSGFPIFRPSRMTAINCLGVLPVAFDDLIPTKKYWDDPKAWKKDIDFTYRMPNEFHAKDIIRMLDHIKQDERLVVNCEAGISRSAAVAYFAAEYMGISPDDLFGHDRYSPNPLVMALLQDAAGFKELNWDIMKNERFGYDS